MKKGYWYNEAGNIISGHDLDADNYLDNNYTFLGEFESREEAREAYEEVISKEMEDDFAERFHP